MNRWLAMALCPAMALAQNAANTPEAPIRVTSRIVYVDVVVRDRSGKIIPGLTEQDFRLEEDGKPQTIDFFSAHTYDMAAASHVHQASALAKTGGPAVDFSNASAAGDQAGAVNIILFDLANTAAEDQLEAHKQLVRFLGALPSGQKVALFSLTDRLTMVQTSPAAPIASSKPPVTSIPKTPESFSRKSPICKAKIQSPEPHANPEGACPQWNISSRSMPQQTPVREPALRSLPLKHSRAR